MKKVFIGVGHGSKDPGAVGYLVEKDVNLVEALACRDFLKAHGAQAFMSHTKNDTLTEKTCGGNEFSPGLVKKRN